METRPCAEGKLTLGMPVLEAPLLPLLVANLLEAVLFKQGMARVRELGDGNRGAEDRQGPVPIRQVHASVCLGGLAHQPAHRACVRLVPCLAIPADQPGLAENISSGAFFTVAQVAMV